MTNHQERRLALQLARLRAVREARCRAAETALARARARTKDALMQLRASRVEVLAALDRMSGFAAQRAALFDARDPDAFARILALGQRQADARATVAARRASRRECFERLREARQATIDARGAWALAVRGEEKVRELESLLNRGAHRGSRPDQ